MRISSTIVCLCLAESGIISCQAAESQAALSVCDIFKAPKRYAGKMVSLRALLVDGGGYYTIGGTDCERAFVTEGFTWPTIITMVDSKDVPPGEPWPSFVTREGTFEQLARVRRTSGKASKTWVTVTGEIRLKKNYARMDTHYGTLYAGYGHLGSSPALLIVKTLERIDIIPQGK